MKKVFAFLLVASFSIPFAVAQTTTVPTDTNLTISPYQAAPIVKNAPEIPIKASSVIASYYVELPFNKTLSIIFDAPIRSVDLGSRDIIANKASDVENVLKVKAGRLGFNETNFSVITADGKFWSFVANFNESPAILALNLAGAKAGNSEKLSLDAKSTFINGQNMRDGVIQFSGVQATQSEVVANCARIINKHRSVRHLGVEANLMEASIKGLYIKENVSYFKMTMENKSNINYDLDYVRFFIVDKTTAKRTSTQEVEILPFYVYNEAIRTIKGKMVVERVYAFQKFTIPDNKRIMVMAGEVNGGRNLSFVINNSDIMGADKL